MFYDKKNHSKIFLVRSSHHRVDLYLEDSAFVVNKQDFYSRTAIVVGIGEWLDAGPVSLLGMSFRHTFLFTSIAGF